MSSQATKLFAALMKMRNGAGKLHYMRLKMASTLLADKGWVNDLSGGGGNIEKAYRLLEDKCFADICGGISMSALLDMYHHNTDISIWRTYNFNLRKLWVDWSAKQHSTARKTHKAPAKAPNGFVQPAALEQLTMTKARVEYERVCKRVETDQEKIVRLEARIKELEAENTNLKSQLKAYKDKARQLLAV